MSNIKRYRKKPVIIEAIKYTGDNKEEVLLFTNNQAIFKEESLIIPTLEGDYIANIGDWIIKGIKGEFYPCKPDIFQRTYELVD